MKHVVAFFVGMYHVAWETFSDDATGKLSWQAFMGVYMVRELCLYVGNHALSDMAFVSFVILIALFVYGPTENLKNYFKGIYGGFRTPETAIVTDTTAVDSQNTTVTTPTPPVKDINSTEPTP